MFTVSLLGKGDRFRSTGLNFGNFFLPIFRIPANDATRKKSGVKPIQGDKNRIGDNECLHFNLKGNISYAPLGYFTKKLFTTINYRPASSSSATVALPVYFMRIENDYGWCEGTHCLDVGVDFNQQFYTDWNEGWGYPLSRTRRFVSVAWHDLVVEVRLSLEDYVPSTGLTTYTILVFRFELNSTYSAYRQTPLVVLHDPNETIDWTTRPFSSWNSFGYWASCISNKEGFSAASMLTASKLWTRFLSLAKDDLYSQNRFIWGDLAQDAANNTRRLDINTSAYIADFFKVKTLVTSFTGLATGLSAKKIANAYLAFQYGVKLTLKDTHEIASAMQRTLIMVDELPFQVARSRASESFRLRYGVGSAVVMGERQYNFKLYYNPLDNAFIKAVRSLMTWDVYPTLANLWDFIPFSFVIDWFTGVSGQLERMDHANYLTTLDVISCIQTTKTTVTIPSDILLGATPGACVMGDLTFILYERRLSPKAPLPISRFDLPTSFNHWLEGASLIIQRR